MRRLSVIVALTVAIPLLFAPTATAHATCYSHTHWFFPKRYVVVKRTPLYCTSKVYVLRLEGWFYTGTQTVHR